jgi:hypothetical protein
MGDFMAWFTSFGKALISILQKPRPSLPSSLPNHDNTKPTSFMASDTEIQPKQHPNSWFCTAEIWGRKVPAGWESSTAPSQNINQLSATDTHRVVQKGREGKWRYSRAIYEPNSRPCYLTEMVRLPLSQRIPTEHGVHRSPERGREKGYDSVLWTSLCSS